MIGPSSKNEEINVDIATPRTDEMQTLHMGHQAMLSNLKPTSTIASGMVINPYLDGWALSRMLERELADAKLSISNSIHALRELRDMTEALHATDKIVARANVMLKEFSK